MKIFQNLVVFLVIFINFVYGDSEFTYYGSFGPEHWSEHYQQCAGKHQSPININELDVIPRMFELIEYGNFEEVPTSVNLLNNGHTVKVKLTYENDTVPFISDGPLDGKGVYLFQQLHFHWGEDNTMGSEDRINNVAFPMELHMVFRNEKYESFQEAVRADNGVAVLALFLKVAKKSANIYKMLTESLEEIVEPHSSVNISGNIKLMDFLNNGRYMYYTYTGSLTTPPCSEDVTWIEYAEPISVPAELIAQFRALKTTDGSLLTHNFRPLQPLNNRTVYKSQARVIKQDTNSAIPLVDSWNDYDDKDNPLRNGTPSLNTSLKPICIFIIFAMTTKFILKFNF